MVEAVDDRNRLCGGALDLSPRLRAKILSHGLRSRLCSRVGALLFAGSLRARPRNDQPLQPPLQLVVSERWLSRAARRTSGCALVCTSNTSIHKRSIQSLAGGVALDGNNYPRDARISRGSFEVSSAIRPLETHGGL